MTDQDFDPRTPCGVRLTPESRTFSLSIFQSTHPMRGATKFHPYRVYTGKFQSTHPLRGATLRTLQWCPQTEISIHAPARGATAIVVFLLPTVTFQSTHPMRGATPVSSSPPVSSSDFNPRTPCGVRPPSPWHRAPCAIFQSTHPLRGATKYDFSATAEPMISIHAPLTGCDWKGCDMRYDILGFQSTHPLRGATGTKSIKGNTPKISIHAPLAGCDSR